MDQKHLQSYTVSLDPATVEQLMAAYGTDDPEVLLQRMTIFEAHRLRFQPRPRRGNLRSVDLS